jgi:hypothetical protein
MNPRLEFDIIRMKRGRMSAAAAARQMGVNPDHLARVLDGALPAGPKVSRALAEWSDGRIDLQRQDKAA